MIRLAVVEASPSGAYIERNCDSRAEKPDSCWKGSMKFKELLASTQGYTAGCRCGESNHNVPSRLLLTETEQSLGIYNLIWL